MPQVALTQQFTQILSGKIQELESATLSGTSAEKDAARNRKKQLREVLKYVSDKGNTLEERLALLQARFTQQVTELVSWAARPASGGHAKLAVLAVLAITTPPMLLDRAIDDGDQTTAALAALHHPPAPWLPPPPTCSCCSRSRRRSFCWRRSSRARPPSASATGRRPSSSASTCCATSWRSCAGAGRCSSVVSADQVVADEW